MQAARCAPLNFGHAPFTKVSFAMSTILSTSSLLQTGCLSVIKELFLGFRIVKYWSEFGATHYYISDLLFSGCRYRRPLRPQGRELLSRTLLATNIFPSAPSK